jgi:hypothetical protein
MHELGRRHRDGVARDWVRAHMWFNLAADRSREARRDRDLVAQCLTSEQLLRAQSLATDWLIAGRRDR